MTIYIAAYIAGREHAPIVESWPNRREFYYYAARINEMRDTPVNAGMSISELCDTIEDKGFGGIGSRSYRRITRRQAVLAYIDARTVYNVATVIFHRDGSISAIKDADKTFNGPESTRVLIGHASDILEQVA